MKPEDLHNRNLESGFVFSTSRSSGPGGQNVNKVNTRVELRFNITGTDLFTPAEKDLILEKLKNRINNEGELILSSQSERTQILNKFNVIEKFYHLVSKALTIPASRRATRPTMGSKIERLDNKKKRGSIKKLRKDRGEMNL